MLRGYQKKVVAEVMAALDSKGSAVLQMPTGAGKTKTATEIVMNHDGVVWFICHRQEIERQAAEAFAAAGIDFGIVSPRDQPNYSKRVQIVSVGTLARRSADLPLPSLVIWDECHHVAAKSWATIRESLIKAKHLGLTATPERLDGKGLREWFAELVIGPSIEDLIEGGFLSRFRYFAPSDPDLTAAKMQAGDYKKSDLAQVMNTPVLIGDAITEYKDKLGGKRALVFCASVEASKALVARFNEDGIPAAHVDGTTPTKWRDESVADLAAGRIKVLSNVEVFTEGFDLPAIDGVILLRPTRSTTLLLQMIGRALRIADGKETAVILDHAGLHADHGWFADKWDWSLDGGAAIARRAGMRGPRRCPECREVRGERVEKCDCGYEFPTGREIGEFDGVLREVDNRMDDRGLKPHIAGYVSINHLSRTLGRSCDTLINWIKKGAPVHEIGGRIYAVEQEFVDWAAQNQPRMALMSGRISKHHFAKLIGKRVSEIESLIRRDILSVDVKGHLTVADASRAAYMLRGSESIRAFAKRHGISAPVVAKKISSGFPVDGIGRAVLPDADDWWTVEYLKKSPIAVMKSLDISANERNYVSKRGLIKRNEDDTIDAEKINLAVHQWRDRKRIRRELLAGAAHESKAAFANRIGKSGSSPISRLAKLGLPCASNGWIHIQRGLEWVRDNTDIAIPPEAWQSANDNVESKDAAA